MLREELAASEDESFGPGTDLVISLFAMLLILFSFWWFLDQAAAEARAFLDDQGADSAYRKKQLYVFVEGEHRTPHFGKDDAVLSLQAVIELDAEIEPLERALVGGEYNQLQIIGYASPDSIEAPGRLRERRNLTLSLERATAVVDHFYRRGIPYECMNVTGFGRSQSALLQRWLDAHPGFDVEDWDERGQYDSRVDPELIGRERRVEIWGIWHPRSQCGLARRTASAPPGPRTAGR